ncbi:MAG: TonB-dependent receptor [Bacteroidia bacterium]
MKSHILFFFLSLGFIIPSIAQQSKGTIRGQILDAYTQVPVVGVEVIVRNQRHSVDAYLGTKTNAEGRFEIKGVPVGVQELSFERTGYTSYVKTDVLVKLSAASVITLEMEPTAYQMEEVVLVPLETKGKPRNEMALISALSFDIEETRRYAGGLDDPVRLAANFTGVMPNGFVSDNMISIRGNSPRGLGYRVEGIDIPNPTHFARIGSSGGSFTIFSNQVLDNSDFFTSAFPAEYGNATAGVFDIRFRNGDPEERKYTLQAGILGVDFAAEGPFKEGGKASFLVNYRFASWGLINRVIPQIAIPSYSDIAFKLNFPTENAGTFGVFGMGGISNRPKPAIEDSSLWEADLDRFENLLGSDMGVLGVNHAISIGEKTLWKSAVAGSYSFLRDNKNYLDDQLEFQVREVNEYRRAPITFTSSVQHNFSLKHTNKTGVIYTYSQHEFFRQKYDYVLDTMRTLGNAMGSTQLFQAYSQSKLQLSQKFTLTAGLHFTHFLLNDKSAIEPRVSMRYQLAQRHSVSAGFGLHSRVEHFATYFTQVQGSDGTYLLPNSELDFVRARHYVIGYQGMLSDQFRLRVEAYYQQLSQVPVEVGGTFTVLNMDELDRLRVLESTGTARNTGVDISLERYLYGGWYMMFNTSVFDSRYTDAEGRTFNTAFNNNYKVNFLLGKEYQIGRQKGKNKLLGLNTTTSALGGARYTPIDLDASRAARETVLDETQPFNMQEDPLLIVDFTLTLKHIRPNWTGTWAFQIKNLLQSAPAEYREYDALLDSEITQTGSFVFPIISYKVEW